MKKSATITVLGIGIVALTGACSTGSTSSTGQDTPDNKNVSLVLGVSGSPFYEALACGAQAKADELGLNLDVSAGNAFAADAQVPVINAVTAKNPAGAAVVPTDAQALLPQLRQLTSTGTKLITVDQTLADTTIAASQVVTDNLAGGAMAADEINELIGGQGKVLVITQPPGSTAQDQRTQGFEEQLATYPGIEYLGAQYQSDDPQKAAQIVTATLAAHPDLAAVFSTNDQGAIGAVTGLQQAGAVGRVKMVAYDAATAEVNALKNGSIQALIAQNPKQEGEVAMSTLATLIDGGTVEPTQNTDLVIITSDDLEKADQYEYKADC
ncbi:sugar ABC transporter substrate-binding protein [Rhodococcus sp. WS3]|uniref:ABC transporter substrate-binding protein n=1 Tax=unclassified Rhodococcus (in: high G+C Gram-positive bacteria) TaxID=192944 RepID=UPI0005D320D8|nr:MULTISPECIES: ABC transporter substrate-binding protein [unclassified Rhodococcus (in: high G+C Gram-positive bacteria)]KJF19304.1 D-ribose-binding periplasmic protein precursor [Rhodococcus sp. AD45]ROZ42740.1 sugar ABC transporter substrate-binding protein [Rhodococcus sp. WS3]RZL21773.1 MAG: sugar ABC transporter substrate-binding protein [Rhodococcus sp. (in: high G+C Gram-positive bacteria)]